MRDRVRSTAQGKSRQTPDQKADQFPGEPSAQTHALGGQVDSLGQKVDPCLEELRRRIEALDRRMTRRFIWTVGIQATVPVAVSGTLVAALVRG